MSKACERIGACVVIPVYNHARTISEVVKGCLQHAGTVLVCDDGSTDGSGAAAEQAGAVLLKHATNQGKGAALRTLFAEAQKRGFKYAVSLDADGQHYPDDIPKLAEEAEKEPGCLVVGSRDLAAAGAPGASQFGRRFSNFWVWFESGVRVEDSQCGFRAYPLPETGLLVTGRSRYDFEVEILLRTAWSGLPIRSTPIRVLYPADRVTHFRPFADNVRISLLNTVTCLKLLLPVLLAPIIRDRFRKPGLSLDALRRWAWLGGPGPFWRAVSVVLTLLGPWSLPAAAVVGAGLVPTALALAATAWLAGRGVAGWSVLSGLTLVWLLFGLVEIAARNAMVRKAYALTNRQWGAPSRGGYWGHLILVVVVRLFGPGITYLALYPITLYFVFAAPENRRASMEFLDRALGPATGLARWVRSYKHFLAFARVMVDRLILGAAGKDAFTVSENGVDHIIGTSQAGKGMLMITAHFGNYDVAGGILSGRLGAPMAVVAFQNEVAHVRELLDKHTGPVPKLLAVGSSELAALDILHALRDGYVVAIQGDRTVDQRVVRVKFLGQEASFPIGPFILGAMSGCPVITTFGVQVGPRAYAFVADPPRVYRFERGKPRDAQLEEWVTTYAQRLEEMVKQHPYQWFNFYDFWAAPS
ncbi:MAG: glycosyltransferase family 2 protein [Archangiaceae bacterium]|nr:glycosyltransferase family 2 protein [Archangiaceae bacterium]